MKRSVLPDNGLDGDRVVKPISAQDALKRSKHGDPKNSQGLNYKLTIRRVYKIIETAADKGATELEFQAPSFVLDGCIGDPIVLARQIKARLVELGYTVKRTEDTLSISWATPKK